MFSRSRDSVDRPVIGRSAAALGLLVALIASLAISATTARAEDQAQVADQTAETVQSANAEATLPEPETPVAVTEEPVVEAPAEPAAHPVEPEVPQTEVPAEPTQPEAPAEQPQEAEPVEATPTEPVPTESEPTEPATPPAPPAPPAASATAQNQSQTWQAIFQVQQGCKSHCTGTSQSQSATQNAQTVQNATAIGGGTGSPSNATALNTSTTGQFIWQVQLGCVAFCYGNSQSQNASQWAQTTQTATATADGNAQAGNVGSTIQEIWQFQNGCEHECYGNSQTQSSTQGSSTQQSATATRELWGPEQPTDLHSLLPDWLIAMAENLGITIQTVWQYQEATCLEHCVGDSQTQDASQEAKTYQDARAVAGVPPQEPQPTPAPTPAQPPASAPTAVASAAKASSAGAGTFLERAGATFRRLSSDGFTSTRLRGESSVESASSASNGASRVDSSASVPVTSSAGETTARTSAETHSSNSGSGLPSVELDSVSGLGESESGTSWLVIALLLTALIALSTAILRKTRGPRTV